jgi:YVTN family beta-propeller protein
VFEPTPNLSTAAATASPVAYVTHNGVPSASGNTVSVIATATNTVVATVTVGSGPQAVALTPNGAFAYVANEGSDDVSVIATATNTVVATVAVGDSPEGVAITPDGAFVYVTNKTSNTVSVIATVTNTVVATVAIGTGVEPSGVAITPDGAFAYITNEDQDGPLDVSVIATARSWRQLARMTTLQVWQSRPMGPSPTLLMRTSRPSR